MKMTKKIWSLMGTTCLGIGVCIAIIKGRGKKRVAK